MAVRQPAAEVANTDQTEQKALDVEMLCSRDCSLRVLKGTIVPSKCGCNFLTGTVFPLVPPEFKHWGVSCPQICEIAIIWIS